MWVMDTDLFGMTQSGVPWEPEQEFVRDTSTIGDGDYKLFDPTAPKKASVSWLWQDDVLAEFRKAWNNPTELAKGANWFIMTLALGTGTDEHHYDDGNTFRDYRVHFMMPFAANIVGNTYWRVNGQLEVGRDVTDG